MNVLDTERRNVGKDGAGDDGPEADATIYFPLMRISDAAKYLGVSRKTIYRLIELDEIQAVKTGNSLRVEKGSLADFRKSGKLT